MTDAKDEDVERKLRQMAADAFPESSERYERACALAQKAYALVQQAPAASGVRKPWCQICGKETIDIYCPDCLKATTMPDASGVPTGAAPPSALLQDVLTLLDQWREIDKPDEFDSVYHRVSRMAAMTSVRAAHETAIAPQWQPIETAPKDRCILLWDDEDERTYIGEWANQRWVTHSHGLPVKTRLWMPLPAAPAGEKP
mgnify:CR=1 FL=1